MTKPSFLDGWTNTSERITRFDCTYAAGSFKLTDIARPLNVTTDLVLKRKIGQYHWGKKIDMSQFQLGEYRLSMPKEVEVKPIPAVQEKMLANDTDKLGPGPPFTLTVEEAAERVRVSPRTVWKLIHQR